MTPIIMAIDKADAAQYAHAQRWDKHIAVTIRSPRMARGHLGPVHSTPRVRQHAHYARLVEETSPIIIALAYARQQALSA